MEYGLLSPELEALMARMGASEQDRRDANKQAAFAAGFSLLGTPKGMGMQALGNAGLNAMGARQQYLSDIPKQKMAQFGGALEMLKLNQAAQSAQQQQALSEKLGGVFNGLPQLQNMGQGGPTPQNAAAVAQPSQVDQYRQAAALYAQSGNTEAAKRMADIANQMEAEYSTTPQTMKDATGNLASVLIGKRGETKKLDYLPAEKLHFADTGNMTGVGLNQYTGKPESAGLPKLMSASETDASKRGWANYQLAANADKRAASGGDKWVNDLERGIQVNTQTGESRPITAGGEPVGSKPKTAPEAYSSQVAGIENLSDAMREYKTKLKDWSNVGLASPDKRANISTAYTDMLMQAKEAYRLGVLNGPDYQLLTSVLTDPVSVRGSLVSNKAMEKQIDEMLDKMEGRKANLAKVYKQPGANTGGASGGWSITEVKK